jgi:hypothetical protein
MCVIFSVIRYVKMGLNLWEVNLKASEVWKFLKNAFGKYFQHKLGEFENTGVYL